ncbi:MAG TPA: DEAD/DEAH box helicase, partial [Thermoanaerobaculia bacterium]|nr:DEAD/DEAH box helicase [Thermoanaerobaculia bacterium]
MDLLRLHLPHRYEDRRAVHSAAEALAGGPGCSYSLRGRLTGVRRLRTWRKGFSLVRGRFEDASGGLDVIWFNQPYLAERIDPAADYLLYGAVRESKDGLELLNPSCERMEGAAEGTEAALHGGRIVPVYPASGSLGPAFFRRLIGELLAELDLPRQVPERVPEDLLDRHRLPRLGEALQALHAPAGDLDVAAVEALNARRGPAHLRLVYEELLELQVRLALRRAREAKTSRTIRYKVDERLRQVARSVLPFKLTGAQKRVLREIVDDLQGPYPMLRLLQGDVGSGKTLVAALALVVALENGYQGAFMAPTEILAEQHYANLERLLGGRYRLGLLTGGTTDADLRRRLAAGEIQLAVGTHALIQEGVAMPRLGLAVVDEQHRFGVMQRARMFDKGEHPHMLLMTATPIPRSLA